MTPAFLQLAPYLSIRDRPFRSRPTEVSTTEYTIQMGRIATAFENLTKVGPSGPASVHLARLTELSVEVLATYAMLGLVDVYAEGIYHHCQRPISEPTPNYRLILDTTYEPDPDEEEDAFPGPNS
jgi:hypothetical protein